MVKEKLFCLGIFMASRNFQNLHFPYNVRTYYFSFSFAVQNTRLGGCLLSVVCLVWFFHFLKLVII